MRAPWEAGGDPASRGPYIVVKKARRLLELWQDGRLRGRFPIDLGSSPVGPKRREGDGRTPEGLYYVCTRNGNSRFYLALGLSYPNRRDAAIGLEEGIISEACWRLIAGAADRRLRPPWDTALGGAVMIHGMGAGHDWTAGCIALRNRDMDELWAQCPLGTPVWIEP
ncbi:MAG: L,D-transpeptidase family protein [Christensenellaceae bacterium]